MVSLDDLIPRDGGFCGYRSGSGCRETIPFQIPSGFQGKCDVRSNSFPFRYFNVGQGEPACVLHDEYF